jgi:hypothetical protein
MKTVRHTTTLFYYDGPQIIEARDAIGGHYIGVMVEPEGKKDRYLIVGVEPERLRQFRCGMIDLRSLIAERQMDDWYLAFAPENKNSECTLELQTNTLNDSAFLPEPGFVLHDSPAEESTLQEARKRNNLVLEVAVEPPEAAEDHQHPY